MSTTKTVQNTKILQLNILEIGDITISNQYEHRINEKISVKEVRLILADGEQKGVVPLDEALELAYNDELDLVEVSPTAKPPVCRIMNYGKYRYELRKKADEAKKKQKQVQVKEIKFRPATDDGDYQVKLRNLIRFLKDGDKGKVTLRFRGREMAHQDLGMDLLLRVEKDLKEYAVVEQRPKVEGRQMTMVLAPIKTVAKE